MDRAAHSGHIRLQRKAIAAQVCAVLGVQYWLVVGQK